ncbi:hypothetical protein [Clostridium akagii]|uniref:hypothetical protein n=1 Tax=Clostridium akagii TaxID=91623 RepID=UPI00047B5863|nr:hypothetical protein [Clostridium akagii]
MCEIKNYKKIENIFDKNIDLMLIKIDKITLINKLKDIENKIRQICTVNKYKDFQVNKYRLKLSSEDNNYYVAFKSFKFLIYIKIPNDFEKMYRLDELVSIKYSKELLDALFEIYSNIETIFTDNTEIY